MTVQVQNSAQYYEGPILIGTTLPINEFTFMDNSHVAVRLRGETTNWVYGIDYTVSGAQTSIRTVTLLKAVAGESIVVAFIKIPITQNISPEEGGNFPADIQEASLDKLTYICQMLYERILRSVQVSIDSTFDGTLYSPVGNEGKAVIINEAGNGLSYSDESLLNIVTTVQELTTTATTQATNAADSASTAINQVGLATEQVSLATEQTDIAITNANAAAASAVAAADSASTTSTLVGFHVGPENTAPGLNDEVITYSLETSNYYKAKVANIPISLAGLASAYTQMLPTTFNLGALVAFFNFDITTASYTGKSFNTSSQVTGPMGLFFSSNGLNMFVLGGSSKVVYQYTLTTAFDISTASYENKSFSVSSQAANPRSLFFSPDGLKMFIIDYLSTLVQQYTLATAFDISTASYANKSFNMSGQTSTPNSIFFASNGLKMFLLSSSAVVYQYTLTTAFDISTASYANKSFSYASQSAFIASIFLTSDGLNMFAVNSTTSIIYQYTLATAFDISTASYANKSFSCTGQDPFVRDLFFTPDTCKLFGIGSNSKVVYQYALAASGLCTTTLDYAYLYAPRASAISTAIAVINTYVAVTAASILATIAGASFTWVNGVGTCIKAGTFDCEYRASVTCATVSQKLSMCIFKNNAIVAGSDSSVWEGVLSQPTPVQAKMPITFAIGDTLKLAATNMTSTGAVVIDCLGFSITRKP